MTSKIPDKDRVKLEEWKKKIKDEWDYRRKLVIFEDGEGNFIIPTTTTSTTTTTTTVPPVTTPNTTVLSSPDIVTDPITVTPKTDATVITADTSELLKIIGITCGVLLAIIIIALVCIRLCRRSAKQKERVSVRRPLNAEPEEHIYAEIEPLQGAAAAEGTSGASPSGSSGIPLPRRKEKRLRGVSSFRSISTRIYKWFKTEHTDDNQSVFYNRSEGRTDTQNPPEPPRRDIANGRTKRGKGTGVKRYESQSRRPLLDGDSQVSTASSNLDSRDNVYNPLLREESGRASGPYDDLRLSKFRSGQVIESDQVPPNSPHDYFTLEKESMENDEEQPSTSRQMENIVEIDIEENKSNDVVVEIEKALQDGDSGETETPKNHEYFILEPTHATIESPFKKSLKSNENVEETHSKTKNTEANVDSVHKTDGNTSDIQNSAKAGSPSSPTLPNNSSVGKPRPVPKPRSVRSPARENKTLSLASNNSFKDKEVEENKAADSEDRPGNTYTSLGDTLGEKEDKESKNEKEEVYVLNKLGDAPKPPEIKTEDEQDEEYLEPLQKKPDYVEISPNPPPRTTSKLNQSPVALPKHSKQSQISSPKHSKQSPLGSPKHSKQSPVASPKHSVETDV